MSKLGKLVASLAILMGVATSGCGPKKPIDEAAAAPPRTQVEEMPDLNLVKANRPERYRLVTAGQREDLPELNVTAVVNPNVQKSIPVISLASGRVVEIDAKLGDYVKKGQLLLKVLSNDLTTAFMNYQQAKADEILARKQLERARLLFEHGAISQSDYELAFDTEQKAQAALDAAAQAIRTLGGDINHETSVVNVYAPVTGTIVEQNIFAAAAVHTPDNQVNLFTIANLSDVWVICDVYENDLSLVALGDRADVRLNAYPDRIFHGVISNIGQVLDPTIRTTKVRVVLNNPGFIKAGMFATATFYGKRGKIYATVPAGAVLHLHDRDWVFTPAGANQFRRTAIVGGRIVNGLQDVLSGISPGQQVINDALALNAENEQ